MNDSSVEMVVNLIFDYQQVYNDKIQLTWISIESENYILVDTNATLSIEFDLELNSFIFTTNFLKEDINTCTLFKNDAVLNLDYFSQSVLY